MSCSNNSLMRIDQASIKNQNVSDGYMLSVEQGTYIFDNQFGIQFKPWDDKKLYTIAAKTYLDGKPFISGESGSYTLYFEKQMLNLNPGELGIITSDMDYFYFLSVFEDAQIKREFAITRLSKDGILLEQVYVLDDGLPSDFIIKDGKLVLFYKNDFDINEETIIQIIDLKSNEMKEFKINYRISSLYQEGEQLYFDSYSESRDIAAKLDLETMSVEEMLDGTIDYIVDGYIAVREVKHQDIKNPNPETAMFRSYLYNAKTKEFELSFENELIDYIDTDNNRIFTSTVKTTQEYKVRDMRGNIIKTIIPKDSLPEQKARSSYALVDYPGIDIVHGNEIIVKITPYYEEEKVIQQIIMCKIDTETCQFISY